MLDFSSPQTSKINILFYSKKIMFLLLFYFSLFQLLRSNLLMVLFKNFGKSHSNVIVLSLHKHIRFAYHYLITNLFFLQKLIL